MEPPDPEEPAHRIAFYVVIGTIGIIGNGMVISVLGNSKTLRTKLVNIFLISQSCLDFICSVLTLATSANRIDTGNHYGLKGKARMHTVGTQDGAVGFFAVVDLQSRSHEHRKVSAKCHLRHSHVLHVFQFLIKLGTFSLRK